MTLIRHSGKIKKDIIIKLGQFCEKQHMKVVIHNPQDIYHGEFNNLCPDILFEINDSACGIHENFNKSIIIQTPFITSHSGTHRKNGIFLAYGPSFNQGNTIDSAKILDIAPTILHMFGMPIPDDMDGNVLKDVMKEEFINQNKIIYCRGETPYPKTEDREVYSEAEEEKISKRLKDLGYLD